MLEVNVKEACSNLSILLDRSGVRMLLLNVAGKNRSFGIS
jgi:hypothetical protein